MTLNQECRDVTGKCTFAKFIWSSFTAQDTCNFNYNLSLIKNSYQRWMSTLQYLAFCSGDEFDTLGDWGGDEEETSSDVEDTSSSWTMLSLSVRSSALSSSVLDSTWEPKSAGALRATARERIITELRNSDQNRDSSIRGQFSRVKPYKILKQTLWFIWFL